MRSFAEQRLPRDLPSLSALAVLVVALAPPRAAAEDWSRWRGPRLNGISQETAWSHEWPDAGPAVLWRAALGTGFSSVVVGQGRVYSMGNRDNTDTVYCLDAASGESVWTHSYECPLDDNEFAGGPTSTPTLDGDALYALSRRGDLFCLDAADGSVRWSLNVAQETGAPIPGWGFAAAPLVHGDVLLVAVGEAGTAVDKHTGQILWTSAAREAGYATPLPFRHGDQWLALIPSGRFYHAIDIASGAEQWRLRWLTRFGCNAADPVLASERVFISSGYNRGSALLQLTDGGDPQILWKTKEMQNQFSSSVLIGGHVYGIDGDTTAERTLKCLELDTGAITWSAGGLGSGALMAAADRLIILSERGELVIVRADPQAFVPLARAQLLQGKCWTAPVLSNARIYCRSAAGELVCVDVGKP